MRIISGVAESVVVNLGSVSTGYTVSYRTLDAAGGVVSDWSTSGVIEIGNGLYGVQVTISNADVKYIHYRAVKDATTKYVADGVVVVADYITQVENILKTQTNKTVRSGSTLTIYDTDGVTPLYVFTTYKGGVVSTSPLFDELRPA